MTVGVRVIAADWPAPPGVAAGCSLRQGGLSQGPYDSLNLAMHVGDASGHVIDNRRLLADKCAFPAEPGWLNQVHGNRVVLEEQADATPEADAAYTSEAGRVCVVMTADCLPVTIASDDGQEVAIAHAGWRGLERGVIEATIAAFNAAPASLLAWLGPAISRHAFEVGEEVRAAFLAHTAEAATCFSENDRGRWQADLYGLARQRLAAAGITRVFGGEFCTYSDPDRFFSYRRDGQCGRMASFVFRTG